MNEYWSWPQENPQTNNTAKQQNNDNRKTETKETTSTKTTNDLRN